MGSVKLPVSVANILFCTGLLLLLTAFVSPNWVRSRHSHDTKGLWQVCEFSLCEPLNEGGWYLAVIVFETMGFGGAILTVFTSLTYVFANTIPDDSKRWVLFAAIVSAAVTVILVVIGVVILAACHQTMGGDKDIFGNIERYDLDWCLVLACLGAGCLLCGIFSLAVYIRSS